MASERDAELALALVHQGWDHLRLQRPLAAWAAWQRALRIIPEYEAARQALALLESADELPLAARLEYRFRPPLDETRRTRWNQSLQGRDLGDLVVAAGVFAELAEDDPDDSPAHYNHALCLAWVGENAASVVALDRSVQIDASPRSEQAVEAGLLAEVLRLGAGAESLADDYDHALTLPWSESDRDPGELGLSGMLLPRPTPPDPRTGEAFAGVQAFDWLDRPLPEPDQIRSLADLPRLHASVIRSPGTLRFATPVPWAEFTIVEELQQAGLGAPDAPFTWEYTPLPLSLADAAVWTFRIPPGLDEETLRRLSREVVEDFYENRWIHIPRRALASDQSQPASLSPSVHDEGNTPLQAASLAAEGDAVARIKLQAVVRFREQLGYRPLTASLYAGYPFDRLRRRLGLEPDDPSTIDPDDPTCMSPAELGRLDPARLSRPARAEAHASAIGLGDEQLAARFADGDGPSSRTPPEASS